MTELVLEGRPAKLPFFMVDGAEVDRETFELTLAHTVPCVPPCATSEVMCANPYLLPHSAETREIRQLRAELDEWCAKVRRLDVPLPLYTDSELEEACVPLDKLRWDIPKRDRKMLHPRSDDLIPEYILGEDVSLPIPSRVYSSTQDTTP